MAKRYYTTGNGKTYPLYEAPYDYTITIYRKDCRRAEQGDPEQCLIAMGAMRDKAIEAAYIGSAKDAYICFKSTKLRKAYALHFTINARAAEVRDYFDLHKGMETKVIKLSTPTAGRTLNYRAKLDKRRRAEIKAGAPVKKRSTPRETRITRIGVAYRPKARITNNVVSMTPKSDEAA